MSKTIETHIEKGRNLATGLRKHVKEHGEQGVNQKEIAELESTLNQLDAANAEVDRLRAELQLKVQHMNKLLTLVKVAYANHKKMLKDCYPQGAWLDYGVPDKR